MFKRYFVGLAIGVLTFAWVGDALAVPSSATLSSDAVGVSSSVAPLLLTATHTFDIQPTDPCVVRLYGLLSHTDGSDAKPAGKFRIATKVALSKRVRFTYRGPAVRVSQGYQTQLTLQTVSTCEGGAGDIYSTADASNVTCLRGLSDSQFAKRIRGTTRKVYITRSTSRAGSCM